MAGMNAMMNPFQLFNQLNQNAPWWVARRHPEILGDTAYSSLRLFENRCAPKGARHSLVDLNLRPPKWNRLQLPPFEKNLYRERSSTTQRSLAEVRAYREANGISVQGRGVPKPFLNIEEAGFPEDLVEAIQSLKHGTFSRLQAQCWPVALSGRDLFAIVKDEGEGKTLGYLLPAIAHIEHQRPIEPSSGPVVLVLTESRQCARAVEQVVRDLQKYTRVRVMCLCSGAPREQQLKQLEEGAEICVATPRRLVSFMEECKVNLRRCTYLVVDGADHMLAVGFERQLRVIADNIRPDRQTLLWAGSRTMRMEYMAEKLLTEPVTVTIGASQGFHDRRVEQFLVVCEKGEKERHLTDLFQGVPWDEDDKAIVYVEMRQTVDSLVLSLKHQGFSAVAIHGKMTEEEQEWALSAWRFHKVAVLVATDAVARHIDADGVRLVANYDYPRYAVDYARRAKLAVRADGSGMVHTFLAPTDRRRAKELIAILREFKQVPSPELLKFANSYGSAVKPASHPGKVSCYRMVHEY
ncbi:hypothetical protein V5799_022340 [Amblyomma americanum]|uniref:RNA helicase n=1 Tax=Amblyomma americanum TaxID=6943 RepID=A0AAQ4FM83_AMBAM